MFFCFCALLSFLLDDISRIYVLSSHHLRANELIETAVSLEKVIPAVRRVSCAPLSACLFSRLEERCSADCPYFVLTLWYLGNDVSVSFLFLCFMIFLFSLIDTSTEPLNRSQTRRLDKSVLGCNHQRTVSVFKRGFTFLRHP